MILEAEEEEKKSANEQKQHPEQKKLKDKGDASNTKAKATAEKKPAKKPAKGKNQFFIFGVCRFFLPFSLIFKACSPCALNISSFSYTCTVAVT